MDLSDDEIIKRIEANKEKHDKESKAFWETEYPKLPLEERKKIWLKNIWQDIFMQGNAVGENLFYMFTEESYKLWKSKYEDIDAILDFVIEGISDLHGSDKDLIKELNKKLGRK